MSELSEMWDRLGRFMRSGTRKNLAHLEGALSPGENPLSLFACQVDSKMALALITDQRLIVARGLLGNTDTASLGAINQVEKTLTKVRVKGSGVDLEMSAVSGAKGDDKQGADQFVADLNDARARAAAPVQRSAPAVSAPGGGLDLDQLERLVALHSAGALTDEEFAAAKGKLLS